jgi:hypothetical protein
VAERLFDSQEIVGSIPTRPTMYTYYWYLARKADLPQFSHVAEEWLLVCPDFPGIFVTDAELDTRTYRDTHYIKQARNIIETKLRTMYATGDTIPGGQPRVPDFFSFSVTVPDREPSAPSH